MPKKTTEDADSSMLSELQDIKKLLILALIRDGSSQEQIADALNVHQSSVSRMFPKGVSKLTRQKI